MKFTMNYLTAHLQTYHWIMPAEVHYHILFHSCLYQLWEKKNKTKPNQVVSFKWLK